MAKHKKRRKPRAPAPTPAARAALGGATLRAVKKLHFYKEAIVTFIDILGFKEIVRTQPAPVLHRAIQSFYHIGDAGPGAPEDVALRVIAFSDSIVRVRYTTFPSALYHELLAVVHMQGALAAEGILLRGAVTHGQILVDGSTIFGPGMVKAYELESKSANYPRVIVDPSLLANFDTRGFRDTHNGHELESFYVRKLLRQAEDGLWFVDYLRAFATEIDDPTHYSEYLTTHASAIQKSAEHSDNNLNVAAKLCWLTAYHNQVVSEIPSHVTSKLNLDRKKLTAQCDRGFCFTTPLPEAPEYPGDDPWFSVTQAIT